MESPCREYANDARIHSRCPSDSPLYWKKQNFGHRRCRQLVWSDGHSLLLLPSPSLRSCRDRDWGSQLVQSVATTEKKERNASCHAWATRSMTSADGRSLTHDSHSETTTTKKTDLTSSTEPPNPTFSFFPFKNIKYKRRTRGRRKFTYSNDCVCDQNERLSVWWCGAIWKRGIKPKKQQLVHPHFSMTD